MGGGEYCVTGKHRYRTERLAQLVLIEATLRANRGAPSRQEVRHYECEKCQGWHLTSQLRPTTR